MKTLLMLFVLLLFGCSSTKHAGPMSATPPREFREAYEVYPAFAGDSISRHLIRSHTTAIMARPISSAFELGCLAFDEAWDIGRRLEIGMVRFQALREIPIPELPSNPSGMDLAEWEIYLDKLTGQPASTANVQFLIGGEHFYASLESAIAKAERSIALQTYLFDNDDVARCVADRLRRRSQDIEVRVMYDGLGTYLSHAATAPSFPENTIPIESMPRYLCKDSNIQLRVIPNTWFSGNHVKSMIFDQRIAYIGGMNVGREYRFEWHDMMIRLEGCAVKHLVEDFQTEWKKSGWGGDFSAFKPESSLPDQAPGPDEIPVRFLRTLPINAQIYRAQLEAIRRARSYIFIENAYFADDRIIYELCRARKRGVDTRVILPAVVNHKIMEYSNRIAINTFLENGVRVYLYPGMSHIKAAIYDGWICAGTANFDKLSLQINRELNLGTSHPATVAHLRKILFDRDFKISTEITEPVSLDLWDYIIELIADEI